MAISKILHMKDCGKSFHGAHLKSAIEYILNPEKTQDGRLTGAINCQIDEAFEQMKATKQHFGKIDKRQGYHLIISFKEQEVNPDTAYEIAERFLKEYLGSSYEAVFAVHDNTEHVHAHIVFNSVSFLDGNKYRYEKGDWAKSIQPITNRLCEEYGLSVINIEENAKEHDKEWKTYHDGKFYWNDMIKRDIDACIIQSNSFEEFCSLLQEKGYEIKEGKHLAVRPPGMERNRRLDTLGEDYHVDRIYERIKEENVSSYEGVEREVAPKIVRCHVKRYKRAKMSGLQKKYMRKLYRTGQLKKKPYSQAWKYKDEIKKMNLLQKEYLFLVRHDIHTVEELAASVQNLTDKKKEANKEKSRVYKAKGRNAKMFQLAKEVEALHPAELAYQNEDEVFLEEHQKYENLLFELQKQGYSYEEVKRIEDFNKEQIAAVCEKERIVARELAIGETIVREITSDLGEERDKSKEQDKVSEIKQPKR